MAVCFVIPFNKVEAATPEGGRAEGDNVIAVLFCYTASVLNDKYGGSVATLESQLDLAIAQINYVFGQSGSPGWVYKCGSMQVGYTEKGDLDDALLAMTPPGSNGRAKMMDKYNYTTTPVTEIPENITAKADATGADCVVLVHGQTAEQTGSVLGIANIKWPSDAPNDRDICRLVILADELSGTPAYTMAHEFGHVAGCSHDRWANEGVDYGWTKDDFPSFSTGYIAPSTTPWYSEPTNPNSIGTVMSYADLAPSPGVIYPYFSDPERMENGWRMGNPIDDNVRSLELTLPLLANHRTITWTLEPAVVGFSTLVGSANGTISVSFTTTSELPNDGKIRVIFPTGFTFNRPTPTTVTALVGFDGTYNLSILGDTITITRTSGEPTAGGSAISFDLNFIDNPERNETAYSGTFGYQTLDALDNLIDQNLLVFGQDITAGQYPETIPPRPPSFQKKQGPFDRFGCLVVDGSHVMVIMLLAFMGLNALIVALRKQPE